MKRQKQYRQTAYSRAVLKGFSFLTALAVPLAFAQTFLYSLFGTAHFGDSVFGGTPVAAPIPTTPAWALGALVTLLAWTVYLIKHLEKELP